MGSRTSRRAPARARPTRCGVAVDAFAAAGHPVLGTSTSNLATRTLEQEAGVRALNTTRLLADLDRGEALAPGTVLLVDEAGMVGTRKYQRLAEHVTAAGGKLIGIGDSRQLAEIEAGGAFRAISERFGAVELAGQPPPGRPRGDPRARRACATATSTPTSSSKTQRGRITVADDPAGAMRAQLADWWQATERHPSRSRCSSRCIAAASPSSTPTPTHSCATPGDSATHEITRRRPQLRAPATASCSCATTRRSTSTTATAASSSTVDVDRRALTVELDAGRDVRLPDWYLDAGWVDHGYALTAHKLQSTTVDRTFALASDEPLPRGRLLDRHPRPPRDPLLPRRPTRPRRPRTGARTAPAARRSPSPALPATSATAAPKPSPQTNPPTRAHAR